MKNNRIRVGVVAPASRLDPMVASQVSALAGKIYDESRLEIVFHPQCFLSDGHFAGDDDARAKAFVEVANDKSFDVVWFARGGYGSCRMAEKVLPALKLTAMFKLYMGYSDMGALLSGLGKLGCDRVVHGPMPADITRQGGEAAIRRALAFLVDQAADTLEPSLASTPKSVAYNLTVLSHLIGTPLMPDLAGRVLMLEDVSEHMYRIDRALFHVTSNPEVRKVAGIRMGRFSEIPPNEPDFGQSIEAVFRHWCDRSGIAYLGQADIGHDIDNKIVPFGR